MFRPLRSAALLAAMSLAGGVLAAPGAAYADTTTRLTAAQMVVALEPVTTATTAAAAAGWTTTFTLTGEFPGSLSSVVDPVRGIAFERFRVAGFDEAAYAVAGKGIYRLLPDARSRAAVRMMGRPAVRYSVAPDPSLTLAEHLEDGAPTPMSVLTDDVHHAGTQTVHDDGSTDYTMVVSGDTMMLRVSPAGTLSGARAEGDGFAVAMAFTYGPQSITLPAANTVISEAMLGRGMWYLDMPAHVKEVSRSGAAQTRRAARGKTVKVSSLRRIVRKEASSFNDKAQMTMIKVKDVRRGVRVFATNPWTNKTVSYTVKASGRKVVVR